jgi:hypothetical protein
MTVGHSHFRRDAVRDAWPRWNGLDDVQVSQDQRTLTLHFLGKAPPSLKAANVVIRGEAGSRPVRTVAVRVCREEDQELDDCLLVQVDQPGDWGDYQLCLVNLDERGRPSQTPLSGFDARLSCLPLNFKVNCPTGQDCGSGGTCSPTPTVEPDLNYLARDYASLRQLLLDRLAAAVPDWKERHVPDLGVTLVELMAFVGDRFSAAQDAVATEAYLDTARLRTSLRRHVRLLDYQLHEGCNARTFVQVQLHGAEEVSLAPGELSVSSADGLQIFEPLLPTAPHWWAVQNEIPLYSWGENQEVLPRGATEAALDAGPLSDAQVPSNNPLHLRPGDFLLLEEVLGIRTANPADARPERRQVVRLTEVELLTDPLYGRQVVEVRWGREDALTFDLYLRGRGLPPECAPIRPSVARGNVMLVDHGQSLQETLDPVPALPTPPTCDDCDCGPPAALAGRYRPRLKRSPLTYREAVVADRAAASLLRQDPSKALPALTLQGTDQLWTPQLDLLASGPYDPHFVVEQENGAAVLRFQGALLTAGQTFTAHERLGNGADGNVGAGTLTQFQLRGGAQLPAGVTLTLTNPLPALGGCAPETLNEVRQRAPYAFRENLQRAVTPDDYAQLAQSLFADRVQRAAATLVWNGVNEEIVLAIDAHGTPDAPPELLGEIAVALEAYRRIGHDLSVRASRHRSRVLTLDLCLDAHASRTAVRAAVLERLGSGLQRDGTPASFHPDRLSFGEPVLLSRLIAQVQGIPGVRNVTASLARLDRPTETPVTGGLLRLGPTEIARLDNDPQRPGHGQLHVNVLGGR